MLGVNDIDITLFSYFIPHLSKLFNVKDNIPFLVWWLKLVSRVESKVCRVSATSAHAHWPGQSWLSSPTSLQCWPVPGCWEPWQGAGGGEGPHTKLCSHVVICAIWVHSLHEVMPSRKQGREIQQLFHAGEQMVKKKSGDHICSTFLNILYAREASYGGCWYLILSRLSVGSVFFLPKHSFKRLNYSEVLRWSHLLGECWKVAGTEIVLQFHWFGIGDSTGSCRFGWVFKVSQQGLKQGPSLPVPPQTAFICLISWDLRPVSLLVLLQLLHTGLRKRGWPHWVGSLSTRVVHKLYACDNCVFERDRVEKSCKNEMTNRSFELRWWKWGT